jgi:SAM-dependent methyltransferase
LANEWFLDRDWANEHASTVDRLPLAVRFDLTYLPGALSGAASILDVGCGGGQLGHYVAQLKPGMTYVGADFSGASLLEARKRLPGSGLVRADGARLPFPDGAFDVVYQHDVLMHHPKPIEMLREMYRVSKHAVVFNARMSLRLDEVLTLEDREHGVLYQTLPLHGVMDMLRRLTPSPASIRFRVVETIGVHPTRFAWSRKPHYRALLGFGRQLHVHAEVRKGAPAGTTRVSNETAWPTWLTALALAGARRAWRFESAF